MYFFRQTELPSKEVLRGIILRSVYLENTMMTFFELGAGSTIPPHKHHHEQISYLVKGSMKMTVGGETREMEAGDIAVVPADVEHSVEVGGEGASALDAWHPVREDYILEK